MKIQIGIFLALFTSANFLFAQADSAAYRSASSISSPHEKIQMLEKFTEEYLESKLLTRSYDMLFDLHVEANNEAGALRSAHKSLESVPQNSRINLYNRFAYSLALKNIGLDSALAYINRALEIAGDSRNLSGFQDTKAYVLYRLGRFTEAEELQRIAIEGHEDDPEYIGHLALFEKGNGKLNQALHTMARALYHGGENEFRTKFFEWIAESEKNESAQQSLKRSVIMKVVHSFLDTLKGGQLVSARSKSATLMADMHVELDLGKQWSEAAVGALNRNSTLEEVITFRKSLALVLAAQEQSGEALVHLQTIENLVDPYDARYWLTLGKTYEKVNEEEKAISAYMSGLVARNDKDIRGSLEAAFLKKHGSTDGIDGAIESLRKSSTNFDPGHYGKSVTPGGKVLLAELFTGADCGPCASSDIAFDRLIEHYPRTALAVLEYHVHVPGPDPMTTNESWDRYKWYEARGTPTAVFEGNESLVGGGPKTVAKNRFGVYQHVIRKFEKDEPGVSLSTEVERSGDEISVSVAVAALKKIAKTDKPVVHIALVERSVEYTGSNGVSPHAYVVRRLLDGADGAEIKLEKGKTSTVVRKVNIADVEKTIKEYLDDPTSQRSWSTRRPFNGWRARPETLNRSNLSIIAWVQDMTSKEVLQAHYQPVPSSLGAK